MTRFVQQDFKKTPKKEPKPKPQTKPGQYTSENLTNAKKIPTKGGYQ